MPRSSKLPCGRFRGVLLHTLSGYAVGCMIRAPAAPSMLPAASLPDNSSSRLVDLTQRSNSVVLLQGAGLRAQEGGDQEDDCRH